MSSILLRGVALVLSALIAASAHAVFVDEAGVGELRVVGNVDQSTLAVGMGRKVPLRDAVRQILPSEYALNFGQGMDGFATKRVSWKGGRPWADVLAEVLGNFPEINVEIDGNSKLLTLSSIGSPRNEEGGVNAPPTWTIKSGDKLSETMSAWAREAGWQGVFWEASDLVSEIDVTFNGSFEEAVSRTMESLSRHGAQLRAVFYGGNKVVRIVEGK